jgi:hypothetical protein
MNEKNIKQILDRLERLESAVFGNKNQRIKLLKKGARGFKGVTGGIRLLISRGFFTKKRIFKEIKEELTKNGYYSSLQAIQTALNKLSGPKGPLVKIKERDKNYYAERK